MNPAISPSSFNASMLQAWSAFSDEFIAVWNEKCEEVLYCNEVYRQFFGYANKQEFISEYSFLGLRKHPLSDEIRELVLNTLRRTGSWTEEVMLVKKKGTAFLCRLDITSF